MIKILRWPTFLHKENWLDVNKENDKESGQYAELIMVKILSTSLPSHSGTDLLDITCHRVIILC